MNHWNRLVTFQLKKQIMKCIIATLPQKTNAFSLPDISCYNKLKRVIAYCFRFMQNCQNKNKTYGSLTCNELSTAEQAIIKFVQGECYEDEIKALSRNRPVKNTSALIPLSPFLDGSGIIRVGGRLIESELPYDNKHQIALPQRHAITHKIIRNMHEKCLHGPPHLTEAVLRQQF